MKDLNITYLENLRQKARAFLQSKSANTENPHGELVEWFIHELKENQAQLISQNEGLRKAKSEIFEIKENYRILFEDSPVSIWEEDFSAIKIYFDQLKSSGTTNLRDYLTDQPQEVKKLASMVRIIDVKNPSLRFYQIVDEKEVVKKHLEDLFDQESWKVFEEVLIWLGEGKSHFTAEVTVKASTGKDKHLQLNLIVPPQHLSTLDRVVISFIDITRLKETEQALIKEMRATDRYLQVANSIILVLDKKGKILLINQKGEEVLGYSKEKIIGKNWFDHFIPKEKRNELIEVHEQVTAGITKNVEFYENEVLANSGELRTIEWHNAAVADENGQIVSVVSSGVDITSRKRAEAAAMVAIHKGQEQERQRVARELHDGLSQQLSAIKMLLSSLESDLQNANPDSQEIYRNALEIVDQGIQDVRRISHNLMPIALSGLGLFAGIEELCTKTRSSGKVKVIFEKSGDDQKIDQTLAVALYRITQELLNNITKHAQATTAKIYLSQLDGKVTLIVQDNGKGIEDRTGQYTTDGIGLKNISSRLQGLQGSISIDSAPEAGTAIKIEVPLHFT